MVIYYFTLFCAIFLCLLNDHYNKCYIKCKDSAENLNIFSAIFILIIVSISALRYNVGADYGQYVWNFDWYINTELTLNDWKREPGIVVLAQFFNLFCHDAYLYVSFLSVVTLITFLTIINKVSSTSWLSFSLFILLGVWASTFNGVRQYLASAIIFFGYRFVLNAKLKYWCIIVFFASLFHMTAWVILPIYFFVRRKADLKQILLCICVSIILLSFYSVVWGLVETLKGDINENSEYASHGVNIFRVLSSWIPSVIYVCFRNKNIPLSSTDNMFINMSVLNAALMTIASNSAYLGRVCIYTNVFNTISIPIIINNVRIKNKNILRVILFIFYFIFWIYSLKVSVALDYHSLFELWNY